MRRPKPHQLVLGIGVAAAVGTLASGLLPTITHWEDHSSVQRPVFIDVPSPVKLAFYLTVATMLFLVSWLASVPADRHRPEAVRRAVLSGHRAAARQLIRRPVELSFG